MIFFQILTMTALIFVPWNSMAKEELSKADKEALEKTQKLLTTPSQRNQFIHKNSKAKKTDDMVNQLTKDPQQKEALFKAASEIFGSMVQQHNGSAEETNKAIKKAADNPEAFYRGLSSDQKAMIKNLAEELEKTKNSPKK